MYEKKNIRECLNEINLSIIMLLQSKFENKKKIMLLKAKHLAHNDIVLFNKVDLESDSDEYDMNIFFLSKLLFIKI